MKGNKKALTIVTIGQMLGMVITIIRSLFMPLLMSVDNYGYFQSYTFYISLFPIIAIGYNDGIYLRYGKYDYDELPFKLLSSSNLLFILVSLCLSITAVVVAFFFLDDKKLFLAFCMSSIYAIFHCINGMLLQVFQITQQFSKYTIFTLASRVLSVICIVSLLLSGLVSYVYVVIADLICYSFITLLLIYVNRKLFSQVKVGSKGIIEYKENVRVGFPLLIAGLVGILFLGGGRLIVQIFGDIEQFSVYSFSITIASFVSVAISSISLVVYPMVARSKESEIAKGYTKMNDYLKMAILIIIPMYFISNILIDTIYKNYRGTLEFLNVIFVIMYLQSFMYILQNTYYKSFRLERDLMKDNLVSILSIFIVGIPLYYFTQKLIVVALATMGAQLLRYTLSYYRFKRKTNLQVNYNSQELLILCIFLITTSIDHINIVTKAFILIPVLMYYIFYHRVLIKSIVYRR